MFRRMFRELQESRTSMGFRGSVVAKERFAKGDIVCIEIGDYAPDGVTPYLNGYRVDHLGCWKTCYACDDCEPGDDECPVAGDWYC